MKYKFVAPVFGLKIKKKVDKGLRLGNVHLSNSKNFLNKSVLETPFPEVLGKYNLYDFYDDRDIENIYVNNYFYLEGEISDINTSEELSEKQGESGFATILVALLLLDIQKYLRKLWLLKDNSIYARDGFVCFYPEDGDSRIFRFSLKDIYYDISVERKAVEFTKYELESAFKKYLSVEENSFSFIKCNTVDSIIKFDKNYNSMNLFSKKTIINNVEKSEYFIQMSRNEFHTDLKIFFYVSAIEALLMSDSKSEVTHQVSEKIAHLLGKTSDEKISYYDQMKKIYTVRSAIAHGSTYKNMTDDYLVSLCIFLDETLRLLLTDYIDLFKKDKKELNKYLKELCLI
ncbi:HEPN domain-containing protein [Vagococcus hydrophili]|uniref:Uncharacterized protein n=1 Tax=Vagococcus hydrophili TaxID=2714947 RepID=A0A6G8AX61_9ENTE|nr:HEPN domain-containing protein [Vagococcus hydrophili]QIL49691.1 hypothetical protein G7082_14860 [Vagococcus hydrophili]